jgi:dephospho-CoA kinase
MAIRNYFIEGVSGSGKTSVAIELEQRGYHVVHGDRVLAYRGDPRTGEPVELPPDAALEWRQGHHIWNVGKVRAIVADKSRMETFFCGGSRNWGDFIDLFDKVFVLDVDRETLNQRLLNRPEDEFGGKPDERAFVLRLHASEEDIPRHGIRIDATGPIEHVLDAILSAAARA